MCLHPRHGAYCDEAHNAKFILVMHSYIRAIFSKNSVIMVSDDSLILYDSLFITAHIAFITAHSCNDDQVSDAKCSCLGISDVKLVSLMFWCDNTNSVTVISDIVYDTLNCYCQHLTYLV